MYCFNTTDFGVIDYVAIGDSHSYIERLVKSKFSIFFAPGTVSGPRCDLAQHPPFTWGQIMDPGVTLSPSSLPLPN